MYYRKLVKESITLIFENSPRELKEKQFFNTYVHIGKKMQYRIGVGYASGIVYHLV
mgnify:CR=1 FL=1